MIPIVWILCGIFAIVDALLTKNKPKKREKLLASKARARKSELTDDQYIERVYKSSIFLGAVLIGLGIVWIIVIG